MRGKTTKQEPSKTARSRAKPTSANTLELEIAEPASSPPSVETENPVTDHELVAMAAVVNADIESTEQPRSTITHKYLSSEEADVMLNEYRWGIQRNVSEANVCNFDSIFKADAWDDYTILEIVHTPEGAYINDGQNRLTSIVRSGGRNVRILDSYFPNMRLAKKHFANTDRNGQKRSSGEAMSAYLPAGFAFSTYERTKFATAIRYMNSAFNAHGAQGSRRLHDFEIAAGLIEWREQAKQAFDFIHRSRKHLRSKLKLCPILSIMMITLRHEHERAEVFWEQVSTDNALTLGSPAKTLIEELLSPNASIERMGAHIMSRKVAASWNAFYQEETISQLRAYEDNPIHIMGTPYKGKRHIVYEPGNGLFEIVE